MTAKLDVRSMAENVSSGRHPWSINMDAVWRVCPKCGREHYSGLRLCNQCVKMMWLWLSDHQELRYIEIASLDMFNRPAAQI